MDQREYGPQFSLPATRAKRVYGAWHYTLDGRRLASESALRDRAYHCREQGVEMSRLQVESVRHSVPSEGRLDMPLDIQYQTWTKGCLPHDLQHYPQG